MCQVSPTRRRVEGQRGRPATPSEHQSRRARSASGGRARTVTRSRASSSISMADHPAAGNDRLLPALWRRSYRRRTPDIDALLATRQARARASPASASPSHTTSAPGWCELGLDSPSFAEWDHSTSVPHWSMPPACLVYAENSGNAPRHPRLFYGLRPQSTTTSFTSSPGPAIGAGIALGGGTCARRQRQRRRHRGDAHVPPSHAGARAGGQVDDAAGARLAQCAGAPPALARQRLSTPMSTFALFIT